MKKSILLIGLVLSFVFVFAQVDEYPENYGFKVWTGQQVPEFKVKMVDTGKMLDMKELRGKVVLIDFSGTQCSGCIAGMKKFEEKIFKPFKGKDLVVLPIMVKYKDVEDIKAFQKRFGFNFPMAMDEESKVASLFYTQGMPRYFVIDRKGKIVYHGPGYMPGEFERMVKCIEDSL